MNNIEILRETKNSYENISDILNNNNINDKSSHNLQKALIELKEIYNLTYSNMLSEELITDACCKNCNTKLLISDNIEYSYQCSECDENFYDFEVNEDTVWYKKDNQEKKKLNSSFSLQLSYDEDEKNVYIETESSSGTKYHCESVEELINKFKDYCYDYLDLEEYSIEIWETDWHRDAGEGFIYETYSNLEEAIKRARKLYEDNNFSSIEVLNNCNEALYCRDSESEDFYFGDDKLSCVDSKTLNEYIDNWSNNKKQSFKGNKLYCKDHDLYIGVDNSFGSCIVEQFDTEKEVHDWLLGRNIEKGDLENEI